MVQYDNRVSQILQIYEMRKLYRCVYRLSFSFKVLGVVQLKSVWVRHG